MKKLAVVILTLMVLSGVCLAEETARTVYSYIIVNTHATNALTSVVPTTSIRPKVDKLIGYMIMPRNAAGSEGFIGIYDGTDVYLTGESLAENELDTNKGSKGELWPFGKYIADGIVVQQGANTIVQLYFVRE